MALPPDRFVSARFGARPVPLGATLPRLSGVDRVQFGSSIDPSLYPPSRTLNLKSNGVDLKLRQWWPRNGQAPASDAKAPVILLVHGLSGRSSWMAPVVDELYKGGFAPNALMYGIDIPEIGQNGHPTGKLDSVKPMVAQVREAVTALAKKHGGEVHLVGLSMGGMLSAKVAAENPEGLKSLALISPALQPHPDRFGLKVFVETMLDTIKGKICGKPPIVEMRDKERPQPSGPISPLQEQIGREKDTDTDKVDKLEPVSYMKLFASMRKVRTCDTKKITIPVRVWGTEQDDLLDIDGTREGFKNIRSKDKSLLIFPKGCHDLTGDPHIRQIGAELDAFYQNQAGAG